MNFEPLRNLVSNAMIRMVQAKKANTIHLKYAFHTIPFEMCAEKNLNLFGSDAYCKGCSSRGGEYNCRKNCMIM